MSDYLGLGAVSDKIIEAISSGIGTLYRPRAIRKEADAHAYEKKVLGDVDLGIDKARTLQNFRLDAQQKLELSELEYELATRARNRLVSSEIQRQANVEAIAEFAMQNLPSTVSNTPVDEDWVRTLFRYGQEVSSDVMRRLWAKVLQTEVVQPESFSLRTLQILSTLRQSDLVLFNKFLSLCDEHGSVICPPPSNGPEKFKKLNYLESIDLPYEKIRLLNEIGLIGEPEPYASVIHSSSHANASDFTFRLAIPGGIVTFYRLDKNQKEFMFFSYKLSSVARELARLTVVARNTEYIKLIAPFYNISIKYEST